MARKFVGITQEKCIIRHITSRWFFCFILQSLEAKYEFQYNEIDLFSAKVVTCAVTTLKTLRDVAQQIAWLPTFVMLIYIGGGVFAWYIIKRFYAICSLGVLVTTKDITTLTTALLKKEYVSWSRLADNKAHYQRESQVYAQQRSLERCQVCC